MDYQPSPNTANSSPATKSVSESDTEKARATIRQSFVAAIQSAIKARRMTHTEAAFETRVGRTVITAVLNGNLTKISTDRLVRIAHRLGLKIDIRLSSD